MCVYLVNRKQNNCLVLEVKQQQQQQHEPVEIFFRIPDGSIGRNEIAKFIYNQDTKRFW